MSSSGRRREEYESSKSRHSDSRYERTERSREEREPRERSRSRERPHRDRHERHAGHHREERRREDRPESRHREDRGRGDREEGRPRKRSRSRSPQPPKRSRSIEAQERYRERGDRRGGRGHAREEGHSRPPAATTSMPQSIHDFSPLREKERRPGREQDWANFFQNIDIKKEKSPKGNEVVEYEYGKRDEEGNFGKDPPVEKELPNFAPSGKLAEETNTYKGVVIKYSEPPEARKPQRIRWRFYPFKGSEALETLYVHRQSAYLLGRDRKIADIPIDHPSCSKQHAVLQYRLVPYEKPDGSLARRIKPYIIDLESANGTFVNGKQIEARRYVELFEKDILKFGFSSREYVLLHESSKDQPQDDEPGSRSPSLSPDPKQLKIKEAGVD